MKKIQTKKIFTSIILLSLTLSSSAFSAATDNLITDKSIGKIKLGMKYSEVMAILKKYNPKLLQGSCNSDEWSGIRSASGKVTYITVSDRSCNRDKIVREITTCSPEFKTKQGIRAGMPIKQLVKIYPNMIVEMNLMDDTEYFSPPNYTAMIIELYDNSKPVGKYLNGGDTMTRQFSKSGNVNCLTVGQ